MMNESEKIHSSNCTCFCHTEGFAGDISQHKCCVTDSDKILALEKQVEEQSSLAEKEMNDQIDFEIGKAMAEKFAKQFNYSIDHRIETGIIDFAGIAKPFLDAKDLRYQEMVGKLEALKEEIESDNKLIERLRTFEQKYHEIKDLWNENLKELFSLNTKVMEFERQVKELKAENERLLKFERSIKYGAVGNLDISEQLAQKDAYIKTMKELLESSTGQLELKILEQSSLLHELADAVFWMTGSDDFNPGGKARKGFEKLVQPILTKYQLWKES